MSDAQLEILSSVFVGGFFIVLAGWKLRRAYLYWKFGISPLARGAPMAVTLIQKDPRMSDKQLREALALYFSMGSPAVVNQASAIYKVTRAKLQASVA